MDFSLLLFLSLLVGCSVWFCIYHRVRAGRDTIFFKGGICYQWSGSD